MPCHFANTSILSFKLNRDDLATIVLLAWLYGVFDPTAAAAADDEWQREPVLGSLLGSNVFRDTLVSSPSACVAWQGAFQAEGGLVAFLRVTPRYFALRNLNIVLQDSEKCEPLGC